MSNPHEMSSVLVTGASRGLGLQLVRALAARGLTVHAAARNAAGAQALAAITGLTAAWYPWCSTSTRRPIASGCARGPRTMRSMA